MPEVYKRPGSPFWYFDYTVPSGARVRKSTRRTNKREAQSVADVQARKLADEAQITGKSTTLIQALDAYTALLKAQHKPSARSAAALTRKLVGTDGQGAWHLKPETPLHQITQADTRRLHVERVSGGAAIQTANHELKHLRASISNARDMGFKAPVLSFKLGKTVAKTRDLTWDEFMAVYQHLAPDRAIVSRFGTPWTPEPGSCIYVQRQEVQDLVVGLVTSGGRWGELATLTWDQFVMPGFDHIRLYGWKDREERVVPVPDMARAVYTRRHATRDDRTPLVFPGKGNQVRRQPTRAIAEAMDACGLNAEHIVARHGRATCHSLRHTFASWLLQRGLALGEVQELLGHASPAMTQRYARYAKGKVVSRAADALNLTPL